MRRHGLVFALAVAALGAAPIANAGPGADTPSRGVRGGDTSRNDWPLSRLVKRQWGIEVAWVRRVALGQMLEFRYRVVDPDKAQELFVRRLKPHLVDEESGMRLKVASFATTGEMRNSNAPKAGQVYWMLFPNPGGRLQRGSRVTIEIGDFEAPGLEIR